MRRPLLSGEGLTGVDDALGFSGTQLEKMDGRKAPNLSSSTPGKTPCKEQRSSRRSLESIYTVERVVSAVKSQTRDLQPKALGTRCPVECGGTGL